MMRTRTSLARRGFRRGFPVWLAGRLRPGRTPGRREVHRPRPHGPALSPAPVFRGKIGSSGPRCWRRTTTSSTRPRARLPPHRRPCGSHHRRHPRPAAGEHGRPFFAYLALGTATPRCTPRRSSSRSTRASSIRAGTRSARRPSSGRSSSASSRRTPRSAAGESRHPGLGRPERQPEEGLLPAPGSLRRVPRPRRPSPGPAVRCAR